MVWLLFLPQSKHMYGMVACVYVLALRWASSMTRVFPISSTSIDGVLQGNSHDFWSSHQPINVLKMFLYMVVAAVALHGGFCLGKNSKIMLRQGKGRFYSLKTLFGTLVSSLAFSLGLWQFKTSKQRWLWSSPASLRMIISSYPLL